MNGLIFESFVPPVSMPGPLSDKQHQDLTALNAMLLAGDGVLRVARVGGVGVGRSLVFFRISPTVASTVVSAPEIADALRAARSALLTDLVVADDHRRRGVGSALVGDALAMARQAGMTRLSLEVEITNTAARGLYERLGFRRSGDGLYLMYAMEL